VGQATHPRHRRDGPAGMSGRERRDHGRGCAAGQGGRVLADPGDRPPGPDHGPDRGGRNRRGPGSRGGRSVAGRRAGPPGRERRRDSRRGIECPTDPARHPDPSREPVDNCAYDAPGILGARRRRRDHLHFTAYRAADPGPPFSNGHPDGSNTVLFLADQPGGSRPSDDWCPSVNLFEDEASARQGASRGHPRPRGFPQRGHPAGYSPVAAAHRRSRLGLTPLTARPQPSVVHPARRIGGTGNGSACLAAGWCQRGLTTAGKGAWQWPRTATTW
jgi:hypothetical protein